MPGKKFGSITNQECVRHEKQADNLYHIWCHDTSRKVVFRAEAATAY